MNGANAKKLDTIKVNAKLKTEAGSIFEEMGMTPSEAVDIFFAQVINTRDFPFKPKTRKKRTEKPPLLTEAIVDAKLKEAEEEYERTGETFDPFEALEEITKEYAI